MIEKMNLTANQKLVLGKLGEAFGAVKALKIRDFADVAPVQDKQAEWAKDPLNALKAKGLVDFEAPNGGRTKFWTITLSGCEQLVLHRAEG